jgi:UDP-N-acetylmuramate--alanine ligase
MSEHEAATPMGDEAWRAIDLRALARTGAVHFMGIAGAGMATLAELVLRSGGVVTGCDAYPGNVGDALRERGARIELGHDPAHVEEAVAVVATSAVPPDHPELEAARRRGVPVLKRAQALGAFVNRGTVIAVAGTHGKTTTTAMTTAILSEAALDPTAFVGGRVTEWGSGLRAGSDKLFVVEADEYDRSFFTLKPTVAVVTSVEADHLDIFGTVEGVEQAFREFLAVVPGHGVVIACVDDDGVRRVIGGEGARVLTYGTSESASLRAVQIEASGRATRFTVQEDGIIVAELAVGAPGIHNVLNALGAFAAARHVGADVDSAQRALSAFQGVSRRFQELGSARGVLIIDDYAHHPTEIRATLAAARASYPAQRIVAVFQPHLYSRTRDFAASFGQALAQADAVWVADVYPAREPPIPGVTGELIANAARDAGVSVVHYHASLDQLSAMLITELRAGDVCIAMGAGNIDVAAHELLERLRAAGEESL